VPEPPHFHHVGYVVASIERQGPSFARSLDAEWGGVVFHDPLQKVRVTFLAPKAGPNALLELVEPADPSSPVKRLADSGGGLHHVCYEVDDLDAHIAWAKTTGSKTIRSPKPAVAFDGRRIAWMITPDNLLIEYLERR
jgi:methylmalonyl-CoA/ethylmalonyl-CoA epimerase